MKRKSAKEFVTEFQETLKNFKTNGELYKFAKENGYAGSAPAFSAFKKALKEIGIDYDAMKKEANQALLKSLKERAKEELTLYSDASYSRNRFAICNDYGEGIYYGNFYYRPDNQAMAELEAAKKAIWVAKQYKEHRQIDALRLILYVDAEWLLYQNNAKQKGYVLTQISRKNDILLDINHVRGDENPADLYTQEPDGFDVELYRKLDVANDF